MSLKVEFDKFYKNSFGEQELLHAIFYNFPIGIRFEIGMGSYKEESYVSNAVYRASAIFNELFNKNDTVFVVINSFEDSPNDLADSDISIVRPLISQIQEECKFTFTSSDNEFSCDRYILKANISDIQIKRLIEEIVWSDIDGRNSLQTSVHLINLRNNIIYHLYDDRGLDVISSEKEYLKDVYTKFNDWILDYDRKKIDSIFAI